MNKKATAALDEIVKAIAPIILLGVFIYFIIPLIGEQTQSPLQKDLLLIANTLNTLEPKGARTLPSAMFETSCKKSPCDSPSISIYPKGSLQNCKANACVCLNTAQEQRCQPLTALTCVPTIKGCSNTPCIAEPQQQTLTPGIPITFCRDCDGTLHISSGTQCT